MQITDEQFKALGAVAAGEAKEQDAFDLCLEMPRTFSGEQMSAEAQLNFAAGYWFGTKTLAQELMREIVRDLES